MNDFDYEELVKYLNGIDAKKDKHLPTTQSIEGKSQSELEEDYKQIVSVFDRLDENSKIQIIYGFYIAFIETELVQMNIRERVKIGKINIDYWNLYYQLARKYNNFMRVVQQKYSEDQLRQMKRIA